MLIPTRLLAGAIAVLTVSATALTVTAAAQPFDLTLRSRVETAPDSGRFEIVARPVVWQPEQTAVVVCDVWDTHHSGTAAARVDELAPQINAFVTAARQRGAVVIHCPSDCMAFYADHPARHAAQGVAAAATSPPEIDRWCYKIPAEEQGVYPLEQSDAEDDEPADKAAWIAQLAQRGRNPQQPWVQQHPAVQIAAGDYVSDQGQEVWNLLTARDIKNILMVGVHTNMCVLGRPFGLRRLSAAGKQVALVRDLTDTMYNPAQRPFVGHFTGTDLIIEHVEKYVCPTITSDQLLGGTAFVFKEDTRPHLVMLISEPEYQTETTLPAFAARHLGHDFRVTTLFGDDDDPNRFPGIEEVNDADLLLISVRRHAPPADQMQLIREFTEAGKPIVGIRTANHAFSLRGAAPPAGHAVWNDFDAQVFGGSYHGHRPGGEAVAVNRIAGLKTPLLKAVHLPGLNYHGSLYEVAPLEPSATVLLTGMVHGAAPEPIAWTNTTNFKGRAFYTSLGHPDDFQDEAFRRLLFNALCWAAGRPIPATMPESEPITSPAP